MQRDDYEDIVAGVREGRFTAEGARRMLEQRQRDVRAHTHAQALQEAHDALNRGHKGSYTTDEFSALFPPSAPLGQPEDDDADAPAHFALPNKSKITDSEKRAAAYPPLSEDDEFRALFGRAPKPGELDDDVAASSPAARRQRLDHGQWVD